MLGRVLGDRYQIQQRLGKNANRQTLLALDLSTQNWVVIKLLSLGQDSQWEHLKLFEREAQTLKALSHPCIPRYLDFFEVDLPDCKGFALVQTYIQGISLEAQLQSGRTFSAADLKEIARLLLDILTYLHDRQPPVIHRDLKPSNILLADRSGHSVGKLYLVDFGSVQGVAAQTTGTITVVGTYGYMPLEQFGGRAVPASDLYSLGATLIYLTTGTHPADLPQKDGKIDFAPLVNLSGGFVRWLRQMTEPTLDRRFASAKEALSALDKLPSNSGSLVSVKPPAYSKLILNKSADSLEIIIPPVGLNIATLGLLTFAIAWNSFIAFWTAGALSAPFPINLPFLLFSLPFWTVGLGMVMAILFAWFGKVRLKIDGRQIALTYEMWGFKRHSLRPSLREHINKIAYIPKYFTKDSEGDRVQVNAELSIWAGINKYQISGNSDTLSEPEMEWLSQELSQWLGLPISKN
ncbi:MAG: serine/threonine protein kinase [Cyanosarcina radialis HA8281-LM2]|jgi:serine/threonine protein kinase|nr:serine/threonine protein kinase [Cyanosarcina radialis HA8281-LM2]